MGNFQLDGGRADVRGKGAAGCGGSGSAAEGGVALALSDLISSRPRCTAARAQLLTLVGFIFCRLLEPSRANCEAGADASSSKDVAADAAAAAAAVAAAAAAAEDAAAVAAAPAAASDANAAAIESSVPTPHTTSLDAE